MEKEKMRTMCTRAEDLKSAIETVKDVYGEAKKTHWNISDFLFLCLCLTLATWIVFGKAILFLLIGMIIIARILEEFRYKKLRETLDKKYAPKLEEARERLASINGDLASKLCPTDVPTSRETVEMEKALSDLSCEFFKYLLENIPSAKVFRLNRNTACVAIKNDVLSLCDKKSNIEIAFRMLSEDVGLKVKKLTCEVSHEIVDHVCEEVSYTLTYDILGMQFTVNVVG